ncbi:unnamed protein product, partial [Rotaria sp. Silwood2]
GKRKAGDDFDFKQSARFHPYTITFKKPQQNEHLISEWKNKNDYILNITEQDQHNHYFNNNQSFPPLMSASTHHQQQFEERLISQVIEVEKKVDNIKNVANELETIIFETILPAIKAIQECSFINT